MQICWDLGFEPALQLIDQGRIVRHSEFDVNVVVVEMMKSGDEVSEWK
jgi:hypothetical protein